MRQLLHRVQNDHIYRGSLLLLTNTVLLSLFGFVFWAVAARFYAASDVGSFAALNAAVSLLSAIAALGLPNTILRHLAGTREARALVNGVLIALGTVGAALCLVFVLAIGQRLPPELHLGVGGGSLFIVLGLVVLSATSAATDAGLVAMRDPRGVVIKNLAGSVLKVVAVIVFESLGSNGLVIAFAVGAGASTGLGMLILRRRLPREEHHARPLTVLRRHLSFSAGNYAGMVFGILPSTAVPLMVVADLGTQEAAWFAVAFLLAGFLNFIPSTTAQVLLAEASRAGDGAQHALRRAVIGIYALLLPALAVLLVAAPWILELFGHDYRVHATTCLRLLSLAALFTGGTYIVDSILAARDHVRAYIFMNVANALLVLGLVAAQLHRGLDGVALGWTTAQGLSLAIGLVLLPLLKRRTIDWDQGARIDSGDGAPKWFADAAVGSTGTALPTQSARS